MKMSVENKILSGFLLASSVLILIGFASYKSSRHYAESEIWIEHTYQVIQTLDAVLGDVREAESDVRGYALTGEDAFLVPYYEINKTSLRHRVKLKNLLSDNPLELKRFARLDSFIIMKLNRLDEYVLTQKREGFKAAVQITHSGVGKRMMEDIQASVRDMQDMENALLLHRDQLLLNNASLNQLVNFIGSLGAMTLLAALYVLLRSETKRRNKAESEIRQSNHFLNTILENIPNMLFVKDAAELRFIRFNKAGEELLGYAKADLIGKNDFDFFPKEEAEFFVANDKEVLRKGTLRDIKEEPISTRYKGKRWLHTKKIPIRNEIGKPLFLLGISEDITDLKKQQDDIIKLNRELEAFSYSVSHDLRTPLRGINSIAKLLEDDYASKLDAEGIRLLGILRRTSQSMTSLIQDLLSFARVGQQEIKGELLDMTTLASRTFEEAKISLPGCNTAFIFNAVPPACGDATLMHQVLMNLFSNALKYSSKTPNPVVEFGSLVLEGEVVYFVKDNGTGFDMKYSDKLFQVFQRLHQQDEYEGTGLGLAIVDRIITKHGGKIWAEASTGNGATFFFKMGKTEEGVPSEG
jgi:PAS domain S-box-containing protein